MSGVLIAGCVYVSILIYGVMVTDYNYNENGEIVPEVVSVQDIKEEKAYDTILYQYLQCRSLYEEVLMLDYRLGKGEEDPLTLAPLYEEKLDTVSSLSIKTDALTVETKYSKVKDMLLSWIKMILQSICKTCLRLYLNIIPKRLRMRYRIKTGYILIFR